jgi:hypothetical protein
LEDVRDLKSLLLERASHQPVNDPTIELKVVSQTQISPRVLRVAGVLAWPPRRSNK